VFCVFVLCGVSVCVCCVHVSVCQCMCVRVCARACVCLQSARPTATDQWELTSGCATLRRTVVIHQKRAGGGESPSPVTVPVGEGAGPAGGQGGSGPSTGIVILPPVFVALIIHYEFMTNMTLFIH